MSQLTGGRPNDFDDPQPPGPWDPVIRAAPERIRRFGPQPDPWHGFGVPVDFWRGAPSILDRMSWVALNPQPLPPLRFVLAAALAQEMLDRTSLLHEIADALPEETKGHVQREANHNLARFVDDICGNDMRWGPIPVPPSGGGDGAPETIGGAGLVVMSVQFERQAAMLTDEQLRHDVARAGAQLIDAGLARI